MKVPEPRKLKSGKWFLQMRLNGVSVPVTGRTAKECRDTAALIKSQHRAGKRAIENGRATLSDAIDEYISRRSNVLSPLTIRSYRIIQRNRFQSVMGVPVKHIRDWQRVVNAEARTCAPKTLKNAWGFIRSVVKETTGEYPPDVRLPQVAVGDRPFLTPEQIPVFVSAVKNTHYAVPALLALSSLRISEIQALRWESIPEEPKFISVRGAVVLDENNNKVQKKTNKNASSTRNVPIMIPELAAAIKRDRKESGPVMDMAQNSLRYGIRKICRENDLPDVGVHGLRHSFASLAYHLQIPERIAMEIGGWSDTATMQKIYTHISRSDISKYQNKMMDFYKNAN